MKNKWLDVLGDVFQVYNINSKSVLYEFCHPMTVLPASKISGFRYIIRSVVGLVLHLFSLKMSKENKNNRNKTLWKKKIWLIGTTQNQLECLVPVHNEIGESCAIVKALTPQDVFCEVKLLALSLCIYPIAFWRLIRVPNISFKTRCRLLDIFSRALGEGIFWAGKFQQYQPDIVVVANDHSIRNRIIMALTRSKGIKTVYIQHAAVGGIEPRLDAMDVALLHGIRSVDKYRKCGLIHAKIYCVGAPKLDAKNKRLLGQNKNKRVSICPSLEDKISYTEPFFKMLKGTFSSVKFVLRIHPRDRRENLWRDLARSLDIEFCDSSNVTTRDFIEACDAMIVSDSNIGIESIALKRPIVVTMFGANKRDPYGFIKDGLYDDCYAETDKEFEGLLKNALEKCNVNPSKLKQFFANIGTKYEGNASFLSALVINTEAEGESIPEIFHPHKHHDDAIVYIPKQD